jgi:hypothetical protein
MTLQKELPTEIADSELYVIHPLFDLPEEKCSPLGLGRMRMSPTVRISLIVLRAYLLLMVVLLTYHMLDVAGFLGHHGAK